MGPLVPLQSQHGVLVSRHSFLNASRSLRQGRPAAGMATLLALAVPSK